MTSGIIRPGRRPVVGVMGSHADPHAERARRVGEWVARQGYHLLTGAGGGVMAAVTEAFAAVPDRPGLALGVVPSLPGRPGTPLPGYPNPWVEIPIRVHLDRGGRAGDEPTSRNHVNVLTSTVVILLPGGTGTASGGPPRVALRAAVRGVPARGRRGPGTSGRHPGRGRLRPGRCLRDGARRAGAGF